MSNYNEVRQSFSIQAEKFATRGNYSCSGKSSELDGFDEYTKRYSKGNHTQNGK